MIYKRRAASNNNEVKERVIYALLNKGINPKTNKDRKLLSKKIQFKYPGKYTPESIFRMFLGKQKNLSEQFIAVCGEIINVDVNWLLTGIDPIKKTKVVSFDAPPNFPPVGIIMEEVKDLKNKSKLIEYGFPQYIQAINTYGEDIIDLLMTINTNKISSDRVKSITRILV